MMQIVAGRTQQAARPVEIRGQSSRYAGACGRPRFRALYPWEDPVALICNDEGRCLGPLNRVLGDYEIIAGTFSSAVFRVKTSPALRNSRFKISADVPISGKVYQHARWILCIRMNP